MNFPFNNFFFFGQLIAGKIYGIIKKFSCLIRGFKFEYNFFFLSFVLSEELCGWIGVNVNC